MKVVSKALFWGLVAGFGGLTGHVLAQDAAAAPKAPLVVEMFTSKFCPNCPSAEHKLQREADENKDLLVIFEHVDYWDRDEKMKDPYGSADISQRQYDYSSSLGGRPGEVFTPMPLIDGAIKASPPLMFSWGSALARGRELPAKPILNVTKDKDGSLEVAIPSALYASTRTVSVLGVEPVENSQAWRARGIVQAELKSGKVRVPAATLPKTDRFVVLLQEAGPSKVVAVGTLGL